MTRRCGARAPSTPAQAVDAPNRPEILDAKDPPIAMAVITAANPVCMAPNAALVAKALDTVPFVVHMNCFSTTRPTTPTCFCLAPPFTNSAIWWRASATILSDL